MSGIFVFSRGDFNPFFLINKKFLSFIIIRNFFLLLTTRSSFLMQTPSCLELSNFINSMSHKRIITANTR